MWTALIAQCRYRTRSVHYPGVEKRAACGAHAVEGTLILMSEDYEHVTCRRCQNTWRFKLGT
jgi:hypothetical protein